MGMISSLLTRALKYVGPRAMPTGDDFQAGMARQISVAQQSQTRFILADIENAIHAADSGNLRQAGELCRAIRRDGIAHGVLSTRTEGLVQLPVRFTGPDEIRSALEDKDDEPGDFRKVFPSSELALLSGDGRVLGVGVAEFVQVGDALPVLRRLDPRFLVYRWSEDRWYYQSIRGFLPVNPGDGRWVLHCPGGTVQPWTHGLWMALARAYIAKEHAYFYRENFSSKLAHAARAAVSPPGANENMRRGFFAKLAAWGPNTVFDLPNGWDVKTIESNGRGWEVFSKTVEEANQEIIITLAGQTPTTTGGTGFQNSAIHQAIRSDLIQADGDGLASTLNEQGLPVYVQEVFGSGAGAAHCSWDTTPPKDQNLEATAMMGAANAVKALDEVLAPRGQQVDMGEIARRYGVPLKKLEKAVKEGLSLVKQDPKPLAA